MYSRWLMVKTMERIKSVTYVGDAAAAGNDFQTGANMPYCDAYVTLGLDRDMTSEAEILENGQRGYDARSSMWVYARRKYVDQQMRRLA